MKPTKLSLIYITILAALILGAFIIISQAPATIGAGVAWDPKYYEWDGSPPTTWYAEIWTHGGHKAQIEVDPATILLEGLYSPSGPVTNATHGPRIVVPFKGDNVKDAIFPYVTHMGIAIPGTYRISLVISGNLYTGEPFSGDGVIVVTVPSPPPP